MLLHLFLLLTGVVHNVWCLPPLPWIANLDQYGCWCDFSEKTRFRGMLNGTNHKTVDEYDFVCKILAFDYFEGMNNIANCEPWKVNYVSPRNDVKGMDWSESCKVANGENNLCEANACASENRFMMNVMSLNMRKVPVFDGYRLGKGFNETDFFKLI